jgi:hypothetical protein
MGAKNIYERLIWLDQSEFDKIIVEIQADTYAGVFP